MLVRMVKHKIQETLEQSSAWTHELDLRPFKENW